MINNKLNNWKLVITILMVLGGGFFGCQQSTCKNSQSSCCSKKVQYQETVYTKKQKTYTGIAQNAKGCAVISGDTVVYIDNLDFWPDSLLGKKVIVRGVLEEDVREKANDSSEVHIQSWSGTRYVLMNAKWEAAN